MRAFQTYPDDLEALEAQAVHERRRHVDDERRSEAEAPGGQNSGKLPHDSIGLALSGGGIRSATFCLGFLGAMARQRLLRRIDLLSTVSGGGYTGAFLGRFYDRLRDSKTPPADVVETALAETRSAPLRWLRDHGEFLAPAGKADLRLDFAIVFRNLLTVVFVLGVFLLALLGLANTIRYEFLDRATAVLPYVGGLRWVNMPLGHAVASLGLDVLWSPWFVLVELALLLLVIPYALAYWLASQERIEGYSRPALVILFILLVVLLALGVRDGANTMALFGTIPLLMAFPVVELAWRRVRQENAAVGTGGPGIEQMRARSHLSRDLGMWLVFTAGLAFFAVVDTAGHGLYELAHKNTAYVRAFQGLGVLIAAGLPVLRALARLILDRQSSRTNPSAWLGVLHRPAVSGFLAALLLAVPLTALSFVSHASFGGGDSRQAGMGVTAVALLVSLVIAHPWATAFINRSSLQATYAARIARTFLGASNPARQGGAASDDVVPGDDVESLGLYRPYCAGGPLHIINVCVNQTVDPDTLRTTRGRHGINMACSSLGVSIGKYWHAKWYGTASPKAIEPLGRLPGTPHPLLGADQKGPDQDRIENLALRNWIAISGAAFAPGMGKATNPALSLLFVLTNLRTGYWWRSGLTAGDRGTRPQVSFARRILWLLPKAFNTQTRLLAEAMARFRGPWDLLWYLSDGGHFENLGGYELIRRKVPLIVMVDAGADPDYDCDDFANFQRKVRIDFRVEIQPFGTSEWKKTVDADVNRLPTAEQAAAQSAWAAARDELALAEGEGGPFDRLPGWGSSANPPPMTRHAALLRATYPDGSTSVILYVKASLTGDEPVDVQHYHAENPDFPHQSTSDQFFDEAQWESYRRLGLHVGEHVLAALPLLRRT